MKFSRSIPPAAAPITALAICSGMKGLLRGDATITHFAGELKAYFDIEHCFLVSSGKAALTIIFEALKKLDPGREEVLIPAFCCYSIPSAIVRAGLKVKLCDICLDTLDFDYEQLADILKSSKPLCIVSVHQFGLKPDTHRLLEIASNSGAAIIEDAAQALGGKISTKTVGNTSDACIFSLGRGKAFSTVEGGVILTKRKDIGILVSQHLSRLPNYNPIELFILIVYSFVLAIFLRPRLFWLPSSMPFLKLGETFFDPNFKVKRMSSFQAGLARGWLGRLNDFKSARKKNAEYFLSMAQRTGMDSFVSNKDDLSGLIRFPLKLDPSQAQKYLIKRNSALRMGISRTYQDSIDGIPELKKHLDGQVAPVAKKVAASLITLPIHPYLSLEDLHNIQKCIGKIK